MPTLNEVPEVAQLLATILTGEPVTHGALAVIPLLAPNLDDPAWLTLEEAGDRPHVTEVSEAGSVPVLRVANGADRPLLLLDGEELCPSAPARPSSPWCRPTRSGHSSSSPAPTTTTTGSTRAWTSAATGTASPTCRSC